jgi:hypothetical protein
MTLKIIAAYNIIIYAVGAYLYAINLPSLFELRSVFVFLLFLALAGFCAFITFINVKLFMKIEDSIKLKIININRWVSFAQIFEISIFGATYFFIMGVYIVGYFDDSASSPFWFGLDRLKYQFTLFYEHGNNIYFGLNLIPIILFIAQNNILQNIQKEKDGQFVKTFMNS